MALDVGVNIKANVGDFLRGIVTVEAATKRLKSSLVELRRSQTPTIASTKLLTHELERQSRVVRSLTLQYGQLRRMLLTFAVRSAIVGFTALVASMNSAVVGATALASSLVNLGGAMAIGGGAGLAGAIQGLGVYALAMKGVGKALTTVGKAHKTAMEKLTQPAKDFVNEIIDIRRSVRDLQLTAQKGLFPGVVRGLRDAKTLMPQFKQAVWDTAQAMGYLAERAGEMAGRRGNLLSNFFQRNIITMRRMGVATENFAAGFLEVFVAAGPLIGHMTAQIVRFSDTFKNKTKDWRKGGQLTSFFDDLRESWDNWMSILGSTGKTLFNIHEAIQPVVHKVERAIKKAMDTAKDWTGTHRPQIKEFFEESLKPMGAFLKAVGRLAEAWVKFSQIGNKDAVRFFDALRTKVIPLLERWFVIIDEKLLPNVSDLFGALLGFLDEATPGFKGLLNVVGALAGGLKTLLELFTGIVKFGNQFGELGSAVTTAFSVGMLIIGWKGLKYEISTAFLLLRRFMGLAPGKTPVRGVDLIRNAPYVPQGMRVYSTVRNTAHRFRDSGEVFADRGRRYREAGGGPVRQGARTFWRDSPMYDFYKSSPRRGGMYYPSDLNPMHPNYKGRQPRQLPMFTGARFIAPSADRPFQDRQGRWRSAGGAFSSPIRQDSGGQWRNARGRFVMSPESGGVQDRGQRSTPKSAPWLRMKGGEASAMFKAYEKEMEKSTKSGFLKGMKGAKPPKGSAGSAGAGLLGGLGGGIFTIAMLLPLLIPLFEKLKSKPRPEVAQRAEKLSLKGVSAASVRFQGIGPDVRLKNFDDDLQSAIKEKNINKLHALARGLDSVGGASKDLEKSRGAKELAKDVHALAAKAEQGGIDALGKDFQNFAARGDSSITKVRDGLAVLQNEIGNKTQRKGRVFREAMSNSFGQAAQQIQLAMDAGTISVKKGLKEMERLLTKQFKTLGFTKEQAHHLAQTGDLRGSGNAGSSGNVQGNAIGGFYLGNKGDRGRDTIPMNIGGQKVVAGSGEYVGIFNATQQKAFDGMAAATGHGSMEQFFKGNSRPHYMAGGGIVQLGRRLERQGFDVGENPAFGGVHPVHVKNSLHYSGQALDINADSMRGGEKQNLDRLAAQLMAQGWHVLWQVKNHFDHLHVDTAGGQGGGASMVEQLPKVKIGGPAGLLKGLVGGELNLNRLGSQALLDKVGGQFSGDTGSFKGGSGGKLSRAQIAGLMRSHGFPNDQIATGVAVALAESGGDPNISNSIGATGLWQILLSAHPSVSGAEARNPDKATAYAYKLWRQSGWQPWEAYTGADGRGSDGPYLQYLQQAFGGNRAAAGLAPPPRHGTPPTNHPDAEGPHDDPKKPKKPKKPKARKIFQKPKVDPHGTNLKPKSKKPKKKKPRKKIKDLVEAGFKYDDLNLDNTLDPITGEVLDVTGAFLPFQFVTKLTKYIEGAQGRLGTMEGQADLTQEEAIIDLYNSEQFPDLTNYLKATGKDPVAWMAKFGETLQVVNPEGMIRQGIPVRGIRQATDEIDSQLFVHQVEGLPSGFGPGGIKGAMEWQRVLASSVKTKAAIKERRRRLRKLKKAFEANVRVRKSLRKKMRHMRKKGYKRGEAYDHNREIITNLRRWKRDSYGENKTETRWADHQIDRLTDINEKLKHGKKWRSKPVEGDAAYDHIQSLHEQRGTENKMIVGDRHATTWSISGDPKGEGSAGLNMFMLERWKEADEFRTTTIDTVDTNLPSEGLNIDSLVVKRQEWTGAHVDPPAVDNSQVEEDKKRLEDLKKQQNIENLTKALLSESQFGVLKGFAQMIGMRNVGAFAHGGLVGETGMALVHKGERIQPDPVGAFRNGMNAGGNGPPPVVMVDLVLRDKAGQLVELVDQRVRIVAPNAVSRNMGQRTRVIRASAGGR